MPQIVPKPWGEEQIILSRPFTIKKAITHAKSRWSLQYHDQKSEILILLSGQATITLGPDQKNLTTISMIKYRPYLIKKTTVHRFAAISNCTTLELSPGEPGTTFRLADDYQRSNETEKLRNLPLRGWQKKT